MTDLPNLLYTSTREIPTLSYTLGPEVKVDLSSGASAHRPLKGVLPGLVDDGARKSNNWLDYCLSGKLGTGSRVKSFPRALPSSNDVPVLLLNQLHPMPSKHSLKKVFYQETTKSIVKIFLHQHTQRNKEYS